MMPVPPHALALSYAFLTMHIGISFLVRQKLILDSTLTGMLLIVLGLTLMLVPARWPFTLLHLVAVVSIGAGLVIGLKPLVQRYARWNS